MSKYPQARTPIAPDGCSISVGACVNVLRVEILLSCLVKAPTLTRQPLQSDGKMINGLAQHFPRFLGHSESFTRQAGNRSFTHIHTRPLLLSIKIFKTTNLRKHLLNRPVEVRVSNSAQVAHLTDKLHVGLSLHLQLDFTVCALFAVSLSRLCNHVVISSPTHVAFKNKSPHRWALLWTKSYETER